MKKTSKEKQMLEEFVNKICAGKTFELKEELVFHPTRKWRFDWAIISNADTKEIDGWDNDWEWCGKHLRLAIEYEGGVFTGGGHTRGVIYSGNAEKYNEAALMGWTVLRFTAPMVRAGSHIDQINRALGK